MLDRNNFHSDNFGCRLMHCFIDAAVRSMSVSLEKNETIRVSHHLPFAQLLEDLENLLRVFVIVPAHFILDDQLHAVSHLL